MVLFHDVVEVFDLADRNRGPMLLVVALDGGFIGVMPSIVIVGDAMAAYGLVRNRCRLFVTMCGEQTVNGLAVFVDGAIEIGVPGAGVQTTTHRWSTVILWKSTTSAPTHTMDENFLYFLCLARHLIPKEGFRLRLCRRCSLLRTRRGFSE